MKQAVEVSPWRRTEVVNIEDQGPIDAAPPAPSHCQCFFDLTIHDLHALIRSIMIESYNITKMDRRDFGSLYAKAATRGNVAFLFTSSLS